MSYIVFLNGQRLEGSVDINLAQTKQVNDIASLSNRNSNYTLPLKFLRTANNVRIIESVFNVGNQSNLPYQKNQCDIIDAETGLHFIYRGIAVLTETKAKEYLISVHDGIIDFYKKIENVTISEIGVPELNHVKNITNIIETWTDQSLPYRYILADYNGKNITTQNANINIDYQVPSALCSYIWNRIFEVIGFDYVGSVFQHEKFLNLWMSYPKPAPTTTPQKLLVTNQPAIIRTDEIQYAVGNGIYYGSISYVNFFPNPNSFDSDMYSFTQGTQQAGTYRLSFTAGSFSLSNPTRTSSRVKIIVYDSLGQQVSSNYINISNANYIDLQLNLGDRIGIGLVFQDSDLPFNGQSSPFAYNELSGTLPSLTFEKIQGYSLGFDEAFIDYKVSDFIKEILIHFALTPYKDKYTNQIRFLTLYEVLQNQNIEDWSNKFIEKTSEKYKFGNYAKRNQFKYKYNDEGQKHNDGFITINNENLQDEITVHQSKIYSPERLKSQFLNGSNVYKIWEKNVKDDSTIEYKDLDSRFYFLRAERINSQITLGSDLLGGSQSVSFYFRESYFRLAFKDVISDWYKPIKSIFDKAKLVDIDFWLTKKDIYNFDFAKLIYVDKLSSYYLVNKIPNFVKGRKTKVECIEVDYFKEEDQINNPIDYIAEIENATVSNCELTLTLTTDYPLPAQCQLVVYRNFLDIVSNLNYIEIPVVPPIIETITGNTITFPVSQLPVNLLGYRFGLRIITNNAFVYVDSNISETVSIPQSCYIQPTITNLSITAVEFLSTGFLTNTYRITFNSDVAYPVTVEYQTYPSGLFGDYSEWQPALANNNSIEIVVGIVFGAPTKFRIRIGNVQSLEFEI